jgi:hypothetical protein
MVMALPMGGGGVGTTQDTRAHPECLSSSATRLVREVRL